MRVSYERRASPALQSHANWAACDCVAARRFHSRSPTLLTGASAAMATIPGSPAANRLPAPSAQRGPFPLKELAIRQSATTPRFAKLLFIAVMVGLMTNGLALTVGDFPFTIERVVGSTLIAVMAVSLFPIILRMRAKTWLCFC